MDEIQDPIAARYGKSPKAAKRNRRGIIILASVLVILFGVWAITTTLVQQPTVTTASYKVIDDTHVSISFTATTPNESGAVCVLKALKADFGIVGYKEVTIPSGVFDWSGKAVLVTTEPAVTGVADHCSVR
jgi:hypothetical protein